MSKIIQVVTYKSVLDEEKLTKYAALAGPAMMAAGGRILARGMPVAVKEAGKATRTVVIEWDSLEAAEKVMLVMAIRQRLLLWMAEQFENLDILKLFDDL